MVDTDGDGVSDNADNCVLAANPLQQDTDADGYGNICDADLDNNLSVDLSDFSIFLAVFGTEYPDADFDSSGGLVDLSDYSIFQELVGAPPGPSCSDLPGGCV